MSHTHSDVLEGSPSQSLILSLSWTPHFAWSCDGSGSCGQTRWHGQINMSVSDDASRCDSAGQWGLLPSLPPIFSTDLSTHTHNGFLMKGRPHPPARAAAQPAGESGSMQLCQCLFPPPVRAVLIAVGPGGEVACPHLSIKSSHRQWLDV